MNRQSISRISAIAPIVMSLLAFLLVVVVVMTGWERNLKDEGAAAHLFQLLVAAQVPVILIYLASADWHRIVPVARSLAFQVGALVLAIGSVAVFKL